MNLIIGDILKRNNKFYRIYDFASNNDVVCNRILYNPKLNNLVLSHDYTYIDIDEIGKSHIFLKEEEYKLLEIIKRKYKLLKLKNL